MASKLFLFTIIWTTFQLSTNLNTVFAGDPFKCPLNQFYLFPCRCLSGGYKGLNLLCENANLATIAIALTNVKHPIDELQIVGANISRLNGPLFKDKNINWLRFRDSNLKYVDEDSLICLKPSTKFLEFDGASFKSIPESISSVLGNLTRLSFVNTRSISEIKGKAFDKLVNLIELDLHNNSIIKIESAAFATLTILERLDLSGNQLAKFERNQFRSTKKLKYLDLSYNKFKDIGKADFNDLISIQTLNLSFNELKELPRSIFSRVSQLKTLNLSGNKFKQIDSYMLRGVRFLREFYASQNLIKELAKNSFSSTTRIKLIDLSRNNMTDIETEIFKDMQWLDLVDLSYNQINKIKRGSFQRMFKIAINLSHNNISSIEFKSFHELNNITQLDLSHNQIEKLRPNIFDECDCTEFKLNHNLISNLSNVDIFANLTGLRLLNLSHNFITEVNRKHFTNKKLYELNSLDLSYNNISDLSGNVFEKFLSIRFIDLSHNSLVKIAYSSFGNVATLLDLDISHNKIKEIATGGVSNLISVKTIYVNDNQLSKMFTISVAVNTIYLQNNNITTIRSNTFPMMNAILQIYLDNNSISTLEDGAFANCLSLNTLSLRHNNLTEVPLRALAPLTSLQNLDLSFNKLSKLDRQSFGSLRILFFLNLSYNNISNLSDNAFEGLLQLLSLNMSHNQIDYISTDVFNTMVSVHTLDLSHNQIYSLDNKTHSIFQPLLSLERLNLSNNRISLIKDLSFPHSPWIPYKLQHLDLSYNTIPILTAHFDNALSKLKWLSLRGNIINEISPNTLGNLTQIQYLDLSHNDMRKLNKGIFKPKMEHLTHLNLSSNKINLLTASELNDMPALATLDLSLNRLTHIDEKLYSKIKAGLTFYFKGNHFHCDCKVMPIVAWIYSEKHKAELDGKTSSVFEHWSNLTCNDPNPVKNKLLVNLRSSMLDCDQTEKNKFDKYFIGSTPIKIRTIDKFRKRRQDSIKIVWFIQNRLQDIASFNILLRKDDEDSYFVNETVNYLRRDYTVHSLPVGHKYFICIFPLDSMGTLSADYAFDCVKFFNSHTNIIFDDSVTSSSSQPVKMDRSNSKTAKSSGAKVYSLFYTTILSALLLLVNLVFSKLMFVIY